jgi:BlaI family transcriptional regulator, penicillinase repressor
MLTGRESQIMNALWELGAATAEQVRESLPDRLHDSTIRTMLRILERKGYARHEARRKSYVYRAAVPRRKVQRRVIQTILAQFFGGSAEGLVLRLLEDERITPEQLAKLWQAEPDSSAKSKRGRSGTAKQKSEGGGQ